MIEILIINKTHPNISTIEDLKTAVINGKRKDVIVLVPELLASGIEPSTLLEEALIPAMGVVGEKFKKNEVFVPEMLVSARAMKETVAAIRAAGHAGVKILVGGAPITESYATEIGADGYSRDPASAVDGAKLALGIA